MPDKDEMEVSVGRFAFVMKAIAENDLWDEVIFQLEQEGLNKIKVNTRQLAVLKAIVGQPSESNKALTRRGSRFLASACEDTHRPDAGPDGGSDGGTHPQ
jgi:hypothetical protein